MKREATVMIIGALTAIAAFLGCMFVGSVDIPASEVVKSLTGGETLRRAWDFIIVETRLPAACVALLAGGALSVAGLMLQTTFDNPLAGPSILGISTGASLGVAIVMLALGGVVTIWGQAAVLFAALAGAGFVMLILLALSTLVKSPTMLLIAGILIGYLASSAIALLNFFASGDNIHSYVIWGLGTFNALTINQLPLFGILVACFLFISLLFAKPLNALLLGARYAESSGVNVKVVRSAVMIVAGALTAIVTAWCGPIGFIGLVVPHIARLALKSSNHRVLLPATIIWGASVGAVCQLISVAPGQAGIIPINAITPVIGVPIIIYIIVRRHSIFYFN